MRWELVKKKKKKTVAVNLEPLLMWCWDIGNPVVAVDGTAEARLSSGVFDALEHHRCAPKMMAPAFLLSSDSSHCPPAQQPEGGSPWPHELHRRGRRGGGCEHPP